MPIADWIDAALTGLPGYEEGRRFGWEKQAQPLQMDLLRQRVQGAGLQNQSIQSYLDEMNRQRQEQAAAPGAASRVLSAYQAQPGSIDRSGAMDLGENPEAAGTPAPGSPGRPTARTVPELFSRGVSPEDYRLAEQYNKPTMASLGLMTPEMAKQKDIEQQSRELALGSSQRLTDLTNQIAEATQSGDIPKARSLNAVLAALKGDPKDLNIILGNMGEDGAGPQPQTMEVGGERWVRKPTPTGSWTWQREQDPVLDWIAAHPKETAGLSPQAARDLARSEIQKRQVTTRIELTQPTASQDAIDRAADYLNTTGQLPAGLGFGNPRLRMQIMDRAAEKAKALGGDMGLAAIKANFDANKAELTRLQTQRGPVLAFATTAEQNLDYALKLSGQVERTQIPYLNKWLQSGQLNWTGDPKMANFAGAVRTAINEYAKVTSSTSGGGVTSDKARADVEAILSTKQTPEQFIEVVGGLKIEMANRIKGYDQQIAATQTRMQGLGSGGGAPAQPALPAGPVRWGRDANGNPVRLP